MVTIERTVNNREAGDLKRYRAHFDVTVMPFELCRIHPIYLRFFVQKNWFPDTVTQNNLWWSHPPVMTLSVITVMMEITMIIHKPQAGNEDDEWFTAQMMMMLSHHRYQTIKVKVYLSEIRPQINTYWMEVIVQFMNLSLFVKQEMYSRLWSRRHLDLGQNWVTWIIWLQWRHMRSVASQITGNSPVFLFFSNDFFQNTENTKASYYCPFVRDCTSDRWYKEPIIRKCFHFLMPACLLFKFH